MKELIVVAACAGLLLCGCGKSAAEEDVDAGWNAIHAGKDVFFEVQDRVDQVDQGSIVDREFVSHLDLSHTNGVTMRDGDLIATKVKGRVYINADISKWRHPTSYPTDLAVVVVSRMHKGIYANVVVFSGGIHEASLKEIADQIAREKFYPSPPSEQGPAATGL